jgi:diguanylate cyclase (GGDEF)-like protein
LFSWERATGGFLDAIGLKSIKVKIIAFALLATLIPSLSMGWLSYQNNRRAIDDKIGQELTSLTSHASRELDLWFRERRYDIKVLASSYEVTENLEKLGHAADPAAGSRKAAAEPLRRLRAYLGSVGGRFADYQELFVADVRGSVLASSRKEQGAPDRVSGEWLNRTRASESVVGEAFWDASLQAGVIVIAAPVRSADGNFLGAMGVKVGLGGIDKILTASTKDPSEELYLIDRKGVMVSSSQDLHSPFLASRINEGIARSLFGREGSLIDYRSQNGAEVMGTLHSFPDLQWGVVAEKDRRTAYSAIIRLRNLTLTMITALLLGIGLLAYLLGLTIVLPLGRLTHGAGKVAGGDLDVRLPVQGGSEVDYMTEVFNEMVGRLRKFHDENEAITEELRERNKELRTLSVTDSLTGLYNRTRLPELLSIELARSRRHQHPFALLMMDIDLFKRFNDTHGHQAGDELIRRVAAILKSSLRSCDLAARYGGEEFLILLTETDPAGAASFAEKLRGSVQEMRLKGEEGVTVSIGAACYPDHGDDIETLIRLADSALYHCKRNGRNQVAMAEGGRRQPGPARVSSA